MDSGVSGISGHLEAAPGALPEAMGWDELQRAKPVSAEPLAVDSRADIGPSATGTGTVAPAPRARSAPPAPRAGSGRMPLASRHGTRPGSAADQAAAPAKPATTKPATAKPATTKPAGAPPREPRPKPTATSTTSTPADPATRPKNDTATRSKQQRPTPPPAPAFSAPASTAPTARPATGFAQRLRSILPWPTTAGPVGDLIRAHRSVHPGGDPNLLRRAYAIAEEMHRGQMRKSGDPYITHPLAVAQILAELGMDTTTLVAALLHDTVEDTSYTLRALEEEFGPEVALLVDGVTKFDKVFYGDAAEAETIRKMILAAGRDVRVLVIKLADRLHNMRTLDARSHASRTRIARATRDVLVPLCDRLGIQALKRELEDCVLKALSPSGYALIADYLKYRPNRRPFFDRVIAQVSAELIRARVDASVSPRPRHLYSIWKDTVAGNYTEPHDLPRVVIVVNGPDTDCYAALGAMHGRWRPVPGRFKDFIASPKNNLYRSLHTTVLGPEDELLEVLIRTAPMHRDAEYGIVANFRFPQHAARAASAKEEQLAWLRRVLDWESEATDPAQFLASLRCDLAESQIIVFTSTGRPVLLPAGATPVDLAYTLDKNIGDRCIAARLNGRLVALSSELDDGDAVEIITRQGQRDEFDVDDEAPAPGPSREWLQFVKTPQARLHITDWFAEAEPPAATIADKVRLGRLAIGLALRQRGRGLGSDLPLVRLASNLGYPDLETLLVAVADHKMSAPDVVDRLIASVDHASP